MKRFKLIAFTLLSVVALVVCACSPVFALDTLPAHAATAAAPDALVGFLQASVFPVVTALFMGLLSVFLNRIGQKYKVDALTQKNNIVEQLAYQGITKAEEMAAQYAGSKGALSGDNKLSIAVSHILTFMPTVTQAQAESMVHALLAQIPGVGASGDTAITKEAPSGILGSTLLSTDSVPAFVPLATAA
jgi:hypothetical protein